MSEAQIGIASVIGAVTRERLFDLARVFGLRLTSRRDAKQNLVTELSGMLGNERVGDVLDELGRDELRAVCRVHGLPVSERTRDGLIAQIAAAADLPLVRERGPVTLSHGELPTVGQVVLARGRQWLVEEVVAGGPADSPLLRLACLDDDAQGHRLELLWDLEIGARVVAPELEGLGAAGTLDAPAHFGAYLHALKWSAVSAADATRFQAPFRAGIKLMAHQLTPLMKALELPRANLFIADDVGLGKTIEAGLVVQELILRQQADFILVVCPAAICLQWRDEMLRRFGLRFDVMSRNFIARRRVERGFGVNPWSTHNRFIVSYPLIRRPEYRDPLLAHLGRRAEKSLLVLDEAHVVAPASQSKYAVDSETTRAVRDLAPRFDNRLFLSATPHNGHSNSFSALLEILDPIRFTRGVPIRGATSLAPIMVRRLKRDLRQLGVEKFPKRILNRIVLEHGDGGWSAVEKAFDTDENTHAETSTLARDLGGEATELILNDALRRYTELCSAGKGRALVFVNLQKRLLSSPEAFARTLEVHARGLEGTGGPPVEKASPQQDLAFDVETFGQNDDDLDAEDNARIHAASRDLPPPVEEAKALLEKMRAVAEKARRGPDAKVRALLAWMRAHLCPGIGDHKASGGDRLWNDRRVIIFTEYGDTKRYLQELLSAAVASTDRGEDRILVFHGGMGDEARHEVQSAFNARPQDHPVRILIATDAAREGVNLQAHCTDLFHFDVPWNPSRMEQRNGRIDRTLQPAAEIRCHYFVYDQRAEDRVIEVLVDKIEIVRRELGSVGAVLMDEMQDAVAGGLDAAAIKKIEAIGRDSRSRTAEDELESQRTRVADLRDEVHRAGLRLDRSKSALAVEPEAVRGVVDVGLKLAGAQGLEPGPPTSNGRQSFVLPELDRSWQATLDTLRPPRRRDESLWDWRRRPPRPVTFEPLVSLSEDAEQLHLAHPLVRRILDRFLAQGYGAHDLSRMCAVVVPDESVARAIAYARLTLFGHGAARLHDELIAVAASWKPGQTETLKPYKEAATAKAVEVTERALAAGAKAPGARITAPILREAAGIFSALWPHLASESDARATDARNGLAQRARKESEDLAALLARQRAAINTARDDLRQHTLFEVTEKTQKRQVELDLRHLDRRAGEIDREVEEEPAAIEKLYEVQMSRLTPVGLVIAWPETMT